jgi:hypothetical protein
MSQLKPNELRNCAVKARTYRLFALIFVLVGILLFSYMYTTKLQGRFAQAIQDPFTITIFLLPFLPAFFLSWLASGYEKKFDELVKKLK